MRRARFVALGCLLLVAGVVALEARDAAPDPAKVDAVFARWTSKTPGCAVGVAQDGKAVLEKAYGMADLEHDVPNAADTIFEAGSVSKQFTAAAVLLLARDGKLSLDDQARKYVPELPDYGKPLTIRHLLTHTSGLRDWGEIAAIAGWPRTSRAYTHAHVLDIVSRQESLNFEPGTWWSYCNTGYNLAAIIVSRVSGVPFAEFCRTRIFEPLGMTRTSWRDDFRRIVKGRAIAYSETKDTYRQNMPFENVHGNGGLLTTVGDLLKWNENAVTRKVGDADFLREQLQPGTFTDGKPHDYAMGLYIRTFAGVPEVGHSGSTAGYRAYLARFPKQHVSVAVLCNVSSGDADRSAHAVAALYLGNALTPSRGRAAADDEIRPSVVASRAGLYRNTITGVPLGFLYERRAVDARRRRRPGQPPRRRIRVPLRVAGQRQEIRFRPARPAGHQPERHGRGVRARRARHADRGGRRRTDRHVRERRSRNRVGGGAERERARGEAPAGYDAGAAPGLQGRVLRPGPRARALPSRRVGEGHRAQCRRRKGVGYRVR